MLKSAVRTDSDVTLAAISAATAMAIPVSTEIIRDVYLGRSDIKEIRFLPSFMPRTSPAHAITALATIKVPSRLQFNSLNSANRFIHRRFKATDCKVPQISDK